MLAGRICLPEVWRAWLLSASQLSRELEIAYSSAWYLLQRLRSAMGERDKDYVLSGIIELDDAYFGAPSSNGKRGRGTDKTSALAAVSLTDEGRPLFLKMQVSKLDAESVCAVAQQTVRPGSEIHSIGKKHLQRYFDEFAFHFNRRFWPLQLFPRLVSAVAVSNILGYGDLTR